MMLTISLFGIENSKCYSIFNDEMCKGDDEMMKCCMYLLTFLAMIALIYWLSFDILYNYTWLVGLVLICLI